METHHSTTSSILARRFKGNKLKKKRIPRPLNAFFIFANRNRAKLKKMFPEKSNREISVELGQIWQKLTVVDRTPYQMESQKAVIQHKLKYPDYCYTPGSPKAKKENVMKSVQLTNFSKDKDNKNSNSIFKRKTIFTDATNPHWLNKSELTVQNSNNTKCQFESSMNKPYNSQSNHDPLRSTINVPQIHQFVNTNQHAAVPNMPWVPWTSSWPYLPVATPQPYSAFPTSTYNALYPPMYNPQFFHGYLWPPSNPLPCFYSRDVQMNDNDPILPVMNNQVLLENMCNNQSGNVCLENGKYCFNSENSNQLQQPQIFPGIHSSSKIKTLSITSSSDVNYEPQEKQEEDVQIDVLSL